MDADESAEPTSRGPEPKVQRIIREYGLEGQAEALAGQWRGDDGPRHSLRSLAAELNRAVLRAAMREAGLRPLDGEVENLHRLLTDDEVSAAQRTEAEAKLERNGLDPDAIRADFVSHQAVHTFLREHRGVRLPDSEADDRSGRAAETIQRTSGRLRSVTERTLERLAGEEVTLGEADVFVSVQVYCNDCGQQFELDELLDRGGCACQS